LLLTMGDAAGIGPEIIVARLSQGRTAGCVVLATSA
jgi:4-hydroxy-L-threonine phosphate dehydrogenase PdxA